MAKSPTELTPQTLIKRVMSGAKEYRTNDYLQAFAKTPSSELHHSDFSRLEIIKLWNSLQNTPGKVRYFTFSLVNDNHLVQKNIKERFSSAKYAWICHDKDKSAGHKHYHYLLMFEQPRSFKSIANDLEIPVTMIEKVYSKKGILDYLTHENDPNKHHYSLSEVVANFDIEEEKNDGDGDLTPGDIWQEFCDYTAMKKGEMSYEQWFDKYGRLFCIVRHFGSRLQMYDRLHQSSNFCTGAGLSTRAECPVSYPRSKKSLQPVFRDIFPEQIPWIDKGMPVGFVSQSAKAQPRKDYRKPNPRSDLV